MKYVPLPAICRLKQWPTIPQKEMSGHGYPVYGANGIIGYHSEYNHENPTLFIGCRGTCGSVHRSSPKSYINGNAMCLDDLKSSYSAKFVFYFLKGYNWKKVITGTGIPQITQQGLQKVLIPELSLEKQSEIANALEFIDEQSKHCTKQVNLLEEQVKSLFNEMFGNPVENTLSFPTAPLSSVCSFKSKKNIPQQDTYWLLNLDMVESQSGVIVSKLYVPQSQIGNSTVFFDENYVLYSKLRPYLNKVVLPDSEGFATTELVPILPGPMVLRVYLAYCLRSEPFVNWINGTSYGAKMPRASVDQLKAFELPLPSIDRQERFALRVKQIDKLRFKYQRQIELLNELMEKKMEEYFGGEEDA